MGRLVFKCWDHGHTVEVDLKANQVEKFLRQCKKLQKVCPECKPANKHLTLVEREDDSFFNTKSYQCRHGHLTTITTFGRSSHKLAVYWGPDDAEDRENVEGSIEELPEMIDQKIIACQHTNEKGRVCGCKLTACDDTSLSYPEFSNFKTKVRVEDVWRKYGVAEPKTGEYDENTPDPSNPLRPKYNPTEFEKRNKERLKNMQRKRNISEDRLPGKPIE